MLHYEAIEPATLELLKRLQEIPLLSKTRLVGGTSLALQIGHRKSIDIDLFGEITCEHYELVDELSDLGDLKILKESKNIHVYQLNGVKLDIFSLDEILGFYEMKYSEASRFMAIKSLVYFDDAERDPLPFMIKEKSWKDVKNRILREIQVC